jgi:hypothetical protein
MLSVVMLVIFTTNVTMLSVAILSVVMTIIVMAKCRHAKCRYDECRSATDNSILFLYFLINLTSGLWPVL